MNKHEQKFYDLWLDQTGEPLITSGDDLKLPWFGTGRGFIADFIHIESQLIIEIQGALFAMATVDPETGKITGGGGHNAAGAVRDYEKANLAASRGWQTLYVPASQSKKERKRWIKIIHATLKLRRAYTHPIIQQEGGPVRVVCR